jgi:two-component system chemotaxis sensor kinase CheA
MINKDDDFLKKLLGTFKIEAQEHIQAMSSGLIELEKATLPEKQTEFIEAVFREAHSLKGAARSVSRTDIEKLCQSLENVFSDLKRQEITSSPPLFDVLHQVVDGLGQILVYTEAERATLKKSPIGELISSLENAVRRRKTQTGKQEKGIAQPEPSIGSLTNDTKGMPHEKSETVRISTKRLESLLLQAEEFLSLKLAAKKHASDLRDVNALIEQWKKEWSKVYPEVQRVHQLLEREDNPLQGKADSQLVKKLEFLDWNHTFIKSLGIRLKMLAIAAEHESHSTSRMVDSLLDNMREAVMLPFSTILESFPRFIRDLCREQGKKAELVIRGADIEIDRRILEEIKAPLIHLVRNCIDHGIEKPEERKKRKKPPCGTITLAISQKNSSLVDVVVADDGAGIDITEVRASVLRLGILSREEIDKMSLPQALSLVFYSGVTTSPIITDVSGRGLGLAIVQEKVEKLGGTISVETDLQLRTSFRVVLPIKLATFRGLLVDTGGQTFVIPSGRVERVVRIKKNEVKTVENRETIGLNGRAVSLVRLHEVLGLPYKQVKDGDSEFILALVIGTAEKRIAFSVDRILDEQEVLVKSLGKQLSRVRNIAGATVLQTGQVVLVLNVSDLIRDPAKFLFPTAKVSDKVERIDPSRKSILVVEDSITARTLLRSILESAGYQVKTAVDGIDAFTLLRTEDFDLMVSDVDMPRMNGFDLTAKVRADKKLSNLPVVLVTALESREDRERGIDAGANAYIVKSSFDQSNLMEVIRRLVC